MPDAVLNMRYDKGPVVIHRLHDSRCRALSDVTVDVGRAARDSRVPVAESRTLRVPVGVLRTESREVRAGCLAKVVVAERMCSV